jgi:hypothetical protein
MSFFKNNYGCCSGGGYYEDEGYGNEEYFSPCENKPVYEKPAYDYKPSCCCEKPKQKEYCCEMKCWPKPEPKPEPKCCCFSGILTLLCGGFGGGFGGGYGGGKCGGKHFGY